MRTSQKITVLIHLKQGKSITPLEAFGVYGIHRLAARIHELRDRGYDIVSTYKTDARKKVYASYRLAA